MADCRDEIDGMVIAWTGELEPEAEAWWLKAIPRSGAVYLPVSAISLSTGGGWLKGLGNRWDHSFHLLIGKRGR